MKSYKNAEVEYEMIHFYDLFYAWRVQIILVQF